MIIGDKNNIVNALKIANQERQIIIDDLVREGVEKDGKITELERYILMLERAIFNIAKLPRS